MSENSKTSPSQQRTMAVPMPLLMVLARVRMGSAAMGGMPRVKIINHFLVMIGKRSSC